MLNTFAFAVFSSKLMAKTEESLSIPYREKQIKIFLLK